MRNENYDIKNAIVFSNSNVEKVDKITFGGVCMETGVGMFLATNAAAGGAKKFGIM